ncbi:uncharacterized protein TNCT_125251 [Trichonephila clavata]|uniref:Uncharacterized protein n=1 Tax=Trichonephila clavata TaxID=2740835 RepID=A0A8X6J6A2_TRICU|nr:uncharacterized protein TNCT_525511 [Trichonephila clavata]GFQ68470.1 uncharacterized protein TNCT_322661 [Trichonephila clavata]GFQ76238.1 uncharacterized protein TNCT_206621 [Trichonephila clavata]GFQ78275.1 uncharacterized protein TNCT_250211 [Trichonephila clavata]GFQ80770.1 uncharacterized protein TNCT_160351 [Trichonephila clavata]
MERSIDHHESQRPRPSAGLSRVTKWRDAWTACSTVVEGFSPTNLKNFHLVFGQWVSILNWIFGNPIHPLRQYVPYFYYCNEPNGPKEILHMYMDPTIGENNERFIHIFFNLYDFNKIRRDYCDNVNRNNHMLVDEARGTINFSVLEETIHNPAEYFQHITTWQMLFLYTLHLMAHWDTYDKYNHAHYDTHMRLTDSEFYNLYFYGQLVYQHQ